MSGYVEMMNALWETTDMNMESIKKRLTQEFPITYSQATSLLQSTYSPEERRIRRKRISSNNPTLKNRKGSKNPHWKGGRYLTGGYWQIPTPKWYTGPQCQGYSEEHCIVYCETHGLTEVPKGFHIHHKDLDPLNNDPSNLEMLTKSEHGKLHARLRGEIE